MIVERRTDRAFQLVAFMRLVILSKVLPTSPSIPRRIREFAIPDVDACVRAREKSDAVISTYLHESLARTTCLHSFHPRNGN